MTVVLGKIKDFSCNYYLMSAIVAWIVAQIIKIFTGLYQHDGKLTLRKLLFSTGGMPSSHSSSVLALTVAAGIQYGLGSAFFAISAVLSMIVMIDASGVRYETGKQAVFLNKVAKEIFSGNPELMNVGFKELVGHTPLQVFMGAVLGVVVAIGMSFVFI